ncbi:67 kDa myosin-cross-reactive antigen family protein [Bifidobacterium lemurum]|uniref:67 kDa myosin-cross-reactive antigen family protein n=1 Tax=Bifidobacterium lemurum TaxID=1603886 RepID=A0A261FVZ6_9BIFI|nr:oleate hydratase [Bifidobacterium lemurum]OZG63350.1 67 kDa myosin-cross-reactive antigen family protein [Bifidobacterium lemurum]QOL34261.1 oleate hydratase [Bifidobacterium lemurum]
MKWFDTHHATRPQGIERKHAHIVGGGIAGMAAAAFLIDDGYMDGRNITIYENLPTVGGSMDGARNEHGYLCRGERELEPHMECLWYLFSKIPSIDSPGMTVLDETVAAQRDDQIYAHSRVLHRQGEVYEGIHDFTMSKRLTDKMIEMATTPEERFEDMTIDEFFGDTADELYQSSMWICFHSMLAFKHYHSMIEFKRYVVRFMMYQPGADRLVGITHTKYNEYDSMIKPLHAWLRERGVTFRTGCTVTDADLNADHSRIIALRVRDERGEDTVSIDDDGLVIITNGSMTTNSAFGDNTHATETNRGTEDMGAFTLWKRLAAKDANRFGHPEKFCSDIDKTKWVSVFPTVTGYPEFFRRVYERYGYAPNTTTGAITVKDSSWDISMVFYPKYFPQQADDEQVFWFDALYGENEGDYIRKPADQCTGEELLTELLYHLGMLDMKDELLAHTYISTCMMPYITSQFMPRTINDRPRVIPEGSANYAFIGQFCELPGDVVFTVETSIRTAMMAAYGLLDLDKPVVPLYEAQYDIRVLSMCLRKMLGKDAIDTEDLPKINPLRMREESRKLVDAFNAIPELDVMAHTY